MADLAHSFQYDREGGTFTIRARGEVGVELAVSGAAAQAILDDQQLDTVFLRLADEQSDETELPPLGPGRRQTFSFSDGEAGGVSLALESFTPRDAGAVVLRLILTNTGVEPVRVRELLPLVLEGEGSLVDLGQPSSEWAVLREGWMSWSPSGVRGLEEFDLEGREPEVAEGLTSDPVTMLVAAQAGSALIIGWLEEKRFFGQVSVGRNGDSAWLRARNLADGLLLEPGQTVSSAPLFVHFSGDPHGAMEHYADLFAARMESRVVRPAAAEGGHAPRRCAGTGGADRNAGMSFEPSLPAVTGWLSWYTGLANDISDAAIRESLLAYAAQADRWRLRYWVVDDGWQSVAGDWLIINEEKFPRGMKLVADGIRRTAGPDGASAGLEPGLWIAPFMVSEASVLAREHFDWLLKDERGEAVTAFQMSEESHWRGRQFALDVTHPEAADYVRRVLRTMVRDWGFSFIKADFLFVAALQAVRHDPSATRYEAMRRGLKILRDEVGQRFLLGCGCPTGAAVGLVDACRTSPDVAPYWMRDELGTGDPATANAVRNAIARWWQHGRWFLADPDAVMVRRVKTDLSSDEAETLAVVAAMSGGLLMWSDLPGDAGEEGRLLLDKVLPPWPVAARPMNLFDGAPWSALVWDLDVGGLAWQVVALVNLSEFVANLSLNLSHLGRAGRERQHAFELLRENYLGTVEGSLAVTAVPPHGARVVVLRAATGGLDFLASNLHLTAGAALCQAVPRGLTCDVTLSPRLRRRGRLFLFAPDGYAVRTDAGLLTRRADGCWSIEVDTAQATEYHFEAVRT